MPWDEPPYRGGENRIAQQCAEGDWKDFECAACSLAQFERKLASCRSENVVRKSSLAAFARILLKRSQAGPTKCETVNHHHRSLEGCLVMSDKPSIAGHLSADLPITSRDEDKLNRKGFAESLAHVIRTWRDKPSLVIGLFGDWGSGKSSLKNLVLEAIISQGKDSLDVVEFNPWQVSSQEMLSETFFREIGRGLRRADRPRRRSSSVASPAGRCIRACCRWRARSPVLSGPPCHVPIRSH